MDRNRHQPMIAAPEHARVFELPMRPGLADCAPSGRLRLDALARWLQDVAYGDVDDAGLAELAVWVLRRTRIHVQRFPRFGEHVTVRTFCSGIGPMWAERRTTIARAGEVSGDIEAVALWVHLDPISWRPVPFKDQEFALYGATGSGRRVNARLHHPAAAENASQTAWMFRATECDIADHVNNAAYWTPLEEELLSGPEPQRIDVEIEFRTPSQPGEKLILTGGPWRWITSVDGEVHASLRLGSLHMQRS
ncbi:MAG: acyl-ACP thioesterase domain-containing protein [Solirubrobacteraceae bacterium]